MRTVDALFDESAAALQFPPYFGENWAAFNECLSEIDGVPMAASVVLLIDGPAAVLADEPEVELEVLVRVLRRAVEPTPSRSQGVPWWDRPAVPFHVVLHAQPGEAEQTSRRWAKQAPAWPRSPDGQPSRC